MKNTVRFIAFAIVLLLAVFSIGSCGKVTDKGDISSDIWEEEEEKEKLPIFEKTVGDIRVQIYSDSVLRLEKKGEGGFVDADTLAVLNRTDWDGCTVTEGTEGDFLTFLTPGFLLKLPAAGDSFEGTEIRSPDGNEIYMKDSGLRSLKSTVTLPSPSATPGCWGFNDNPRIIPSEQGFTVGADNTDYKEDNGWTNEKSVQDFYLFVPGGDSFRLREDFVRLTGSSDLVPLKTLGFWFSRWYNYSDKEALALIQKFRDEGYPIDMFVVDTGWRSSSDGTGYRVNRKYFPNLKGFFTQAHDANVLIVMNDHVHSSPKEILSYEQLKWFNEGLAGNLDAGLDAWWFDRNWTSQLRSSFASVDCDLFGQFMYFAITENWKGSANNTRSFLLSNVYNIVNGSYKSGGAHVGLHRNSIQWTGDIGSTSESLKNEIQNMVKSGVEYSLGYYSSDIGGHTSTPSESLFIRWTQYGCLSPIMRYHSTWGITREPWEVGQNANDIAKEYVNMRYRLMPLFYTSAYENYAKGLPIARRMDFYYPQSAQARDTTQYMLGDDIIVAPYTNPDAAIDTSIRYETADGKEGLYGEFFNSEDLSGDVVYAGVDDSISFDWGTGSPHEGVNGDHFSARWEGYLTAADDVRLACLSDDGVRVYLDGKLIIDEWHASDSETHHSDTVLEGGKKYAIKVEYCDMTNHAKLSLYPVPGDPAGITETRKVFLPEGTWVNLFTGEEFTGPVTTQVTMSIREMPIFIKKGSTTVLSPAHDHLECSDWENTVLDIYAALGTEDKTVQYEDDGVSENYQKGAYRLTTYKTLFDDAGKMKLMVSSKTENGEDPCGFENRKVTLRIHAAELHSVKLNGEELTFTAIEKDETAYPFATSGSSPDGRVYEATFTVPVTERYIVTAE